MQDLELAHTLTRALHLLALSLAPRWLSPDPAPSSGAAGLLAGAVLLTVLLATWRFRRSVGTQLATVAAAASVAAVTAAVVAALVFHGARGPLARALPYVAPLWWAALALAAAATAHRLLLPKLRVRAAWVSAGVVTGIGVILLTSAAPKLRSPHDMWRRALDLEPGHEEAQLRVAAELAARRDFLQIVANTQRCISEHRDSCSCRGLRAWALMKLQRREEGLVAARTAASICDDHPFVHATLATALALAGDHRDALAHVQRGRELLEQWRGDKKMSLVELHAAQALALAGTGENAAALAEAQRAIDAGGGRDALLLAAAIAIAAGELEVASRHLEAILTRDPDDADALYDRALIADRRGDYNRAREDYLATLRLSPQYAAARYNLAVLTWRRGVREEARHHVQLFGRDYPQDWRGAQLTAMVSAAEPEAPPPGTTAASSAIAAPPATASGPAPPGLPAPGTQAGASAGPPQD